MKPLNRCKELSQLTFTNINSRLVKKSSSRVTTQLVWRAPTAHSTKMYKKRPVKLSTSDLKPCFNKLCSVLLIITPKSYISNEIHQSGGRIQKSSIQKHTQVFKFHKNTRYIKYKL